MATYLLVRHKISDFAEWKRGYDAHLPKRVEAGLAEKYLLRDAQDPNEVTLFFETGDIQRAKAFIESADLRSLHLLPIGPEAGAATPTTPVTVPELFASGRPVKMGYCMSRRKVSVIGT